MPDRRRRGLGVIAGVAAAAAGGGLVQARPGTQTWFRSLRKPPLQPPDQVFAPVWSVLYAGIAVNGYRLFTREESPEVRAARRLWVAQLALNGAWTPLFFGLRRPGVAMVDIVALDAAAVALRRQSAKLDEGSRHWALDPYLAWIAFATYLNASIVWLNRDR
jgi:benzodiazapine receptor